MFRATLGTPIAAEEPAVSAIRCRNDLRNRDIPAADAKVAPCFSVSNPISGELVAIEPGFSSLCPYACRTAVVPTFRRSSSET